VHIDFSPAKDAINRARHEGLSLGLAREFDWLAGQFFPAKTVKGETRTQMVVAHGESVYTVIYTLRNEQPWIISLRYASRKERRNHAR
jgi:uncharacterized DUF497 family protein